MKQLITLFGLLSFYLFALPNAYGQHIYSIGQMKRSDCQGDPLEVTKDWEKRACATFSVNEAYDCGMAWVREKLTEPRCFFMMVEQPSYDPNTDRSFLRYYDALKEFVIKPETDRRTRVTTLACLKQALKSIDERQKLELDRTANAALKDMLIKKSGVDESRRILASESEGAQKLGSLVARYRQELIKLTADFISLRSSDNGTYKAVLAALQRIHIHSELSKTASLDDLLKYSIEVDDNYRQLESGLSLQMFQLRILLNRIKLLDDLTSGRGFLAQEMDDANKIASKHNLPSPKGPPLLTKEVEKLLAHYQEASAKAYKFFETYHKQVDMRTNLLILQKADLDTRLHKSQSQDLSSSTLFLKEVNDLTKKMWGLVPENGSIPLFSEQYNTLSLILSKESLCKSSDKGKLPWIQTGCNFLQAEIASIKTYQTETLPVMIGAYMNYLNAKDNNLIQKQIELVNQKLSEGKLGQAIEIYDSLASVQNKERAQ
jgi:hypothetical protein